MEMYRGLTTMKLPEQFLTKHAGLEIVFGGSESCVDPEEIALTKSGCRVQGAGCELLGTVP